MLYPRNTRESLEKALFENPTSEYRCTPFWAWNCALDADEMRRQIDIFKRMGMGGFHMHSRSGMATEYLGDEFMAVVSACVEKARQEGMLAWLYDEDRWPSGAAGGLVTCDPRWRSRYLLFTPRPYGTAGHVVSGDSRAEGGRNEGGKLLARYAVTLDAEGRLGGYSRLSEGQEPPAGAALWYAYLETASSSTWYNNQAYLDTLNPRAVARFVEVTHERYRQAVGGDFGGVIPAIFTDEPQFTRKSTLGFAFSQADINLPYTDDFGETYRAAYGEDILDRLPELFWELPGGAVSVSRYHYHDHVAERFAAAFADTVGDWCRRNNIMLTGHMMEEPTLHSQTAALGDAMRSYRSFQLPGIDILCDRREFTTAKQAQSASRQYGCPGVLSELYGVTNWDFDFRGHKLQGDWQAALGVTVRVPHLSWASMEGEAKRDYPASIHYQSPWYEEYPYVEDYFARVNTALTRGKARVRVGVVHPVESYWLYWGPREQTAAVREEMDEKFKNLANWLLLGLVDFDYLSESLLPGQCPAAGAPLRVGEMAYDAVIVPDCVTLRSTTLDRLEAFAAAGGQLIFAGEAPRYADALPSDRGAALARRTRQIPFTRLSILSALEPLREVDVKTAVGSRAANLLHQIREDGEGRWLFLCHAYPPANPDVLSAEWYELKLRGEWSVTLYDAMTGDVRALPCSVSAGMTRVELTLYAHDSALFYLAPAGSGAVGAAKAPQAVFNGPERRFSGRVPVRLSEPNVLLLDMAEYAFDDGDWQPREEILRIETAFRQAIGYPSRSGHLPQPWVVPADTEYRHFLRLRYRIQSSVAVTGCTLAIEHPELARITFNGEAVGTASDGWFVDKSIRTLSLPDVKAGENILEVRAPVGNRFGVEWAYLLGDFGVNVAGDTARITGPVRSLAFGDWSCQGLPFYAGNVTYLLDVEADGPFEIEVPQYRNPLLAVDLDGKRAGVIAYGPYRLAVDASPGRHTLELTAFGNRVNAFGAVHNCDPGVSWHGPFAWRSQGLGWSYEYRLRPTGVLVSPRIRTRS